MEKTQKLQRVYIYKLLESKKVKDGIFKIKVDSKGDIVKFTVESEIKIKNHIKKGNEQKKL